MFAKRNYSLKLFLKLIQDDVFWVFGTDVMVSVATGLDIPIKLVFPKSAIMGSNMMLGLGDIVGNVLISSESSR